jgi:pimeloyl-ACP methyl ester carboxylesterase
MARDAVGLMDGLGIRAAHVVGVSMGGMIAQILAAEHPDRVRSLISIMSSPAPILPRRKVLRALLRPAPRDRDQAIRRMHDFFRLVGGAGYPPTEVELKIKVDRSVGRSFRPDGFTRQLIAIQTGPSRVPLLHRVRAPTLVIRWCRSSAGPGPPPRFPAPACASCREWATFFPRRWSRCLSRKSLDTA